MEAVNAVTLVCYASSVFFPNDQYLFSRLPLLPPILSRGKAFPEAHSSVSGCKCWLKGNVSLINIKPKVYAKHFLLRLFRSLHYWVYFLWLLALKPSFPISLFYWALMCRTQHILYSPVMAFEVKFKNATGFLGDAGKLSILTCLYHVLKDFDLSTFKISPNVTKYRWQKKWVPGAESRGLARRQRKWLLSPRCGLWGHKEQKPFCFQIAPSKSPLGLKCLNLRWTFLS